MESKLKPGDKVRIIGYGHIFKSSKTEPRFSFKIVEETEDEIVYDILPQLIGRKGVIKEESMGQYALDGIIGKTAWFDRSQLELCKTPIERLWYWFPYIPVLGFVIGILMSLEIINDAENCCIYESNSHLALSAIVQILACISLILLI